jgi:hypothetical protein
VTVNFFPFLKADFLSTDEVFLRKRPRILVIASLLADGVWEIFEASEARFPSTAFVLAGCKGDAMVFKAEIASGVDPIPFDDPSRFWTSIKSLGDD